MMSAMTWGARSEVAMLFAFGILLVAVGAVVGYVAQPFDQSGSSLVFLLGCLASVAGGAVVLIGVIAVGVRLGQRP